MAAIAVIILLLSLALVFFLRLPSWLTVNEAPAKSDAIVVLNGHNIKGRIEHAVSLYKQGLAPRIIISGETELEKETGISILKIYAQSLGVSGESVEVQNRSLSTYEDAVYVDRLLRERKYRSFILVTSPLHSRRSSILFKRVLSPDIRWMISCKVPDNHFQNWWNDVQLAREVFYELLAIPYCLVRKQ